MLPKKDLQGLCYLAVMGRKSCPRAFWKRWEALESISILLSVVLSAYEPCHLL